MPVEIRELLVRTTIESSKPKKEKQPEGSAPGGAPGESGSTPSTPSPAASGGADKSMAKMHERLLKDCVNTIMDNLASYPKER